MRRRFLTRHGILHVCRHFVIKELFDAIFFRHWIADSPSVQDEREFRQPLRGVAAGKRSIS